LARDFAAAREQAEDCDAADCQFPRQGWRFLGRDLEVLSSSCSLTATKRLGQNGEMTPEPATYPGSRFPSSIISYAVWLYHVFGLSLRREP
jgi:hypothetical protein